MLRAQKRMTGAQQYARTNPTDGGEATYFVSPRLDWEPRHGMDLDAGVRMMRDNLEPEPFPRPFAIGALNGFMPQIDVWRFGGSAKMAKPPTGPFIGEESAPGTEGYFPLWYDDIMKEY
jgi:hypothetical protein